MIMVCFPFLLSEKIWSLIRHKVEFIVQCPMSKVTILIIFYHHYLSYSCTYIIYVYASSLTLLFAEQCIYIIKQSAKFDDLWLYVLLALSMYMCILSILLKLAQPAASFDHVLNVTTDAFSLPALARPFSTQLVYLFYYISHR